MNKEDIVIHDKHSYLMKPYFYTLQEHIPTQTKQISIWASLIYSFFIDGDLREYSRTQILDSSFELTHNKSLRRFVFLILIIPDY